MMPSSETQEPSLETADWERWINSLAANEGSLAPGTDPFAELDKQIELAQEEMNTPDGARRLDDLLEERDLFAESLTPENSPEAAQDLLDARFLSRPDLDSDGATSGYTLQYMELYDNGQNHVSGRVMDIAHYEEPERATQVYDLIQSSIAEGNLAQADYPVLAAELARSHELPDDDWRDATPDDHQRFLEQNPLLDESSRDLPTDGMLGDPAFSGNLFREATADPQQAAQEQASLVNEQALAALKGIGLAVQTDFDVARDAFYDPQRHEHLINGIFQQDPADASQNCRPMLIALTIPETGVGFTAQAMEYGAISGLSDVQADHDQVQTALEAGGIEAGIAAVEGLEAERTVPEVNSPSLEIS